MLCIKLKTSQFVIFLNKNNLNELDVEDPKKKERLCIGIAKFYVKIAHLYGAILKSLNLSCAGFLL